MSQIILNWLNEEIQLSKRVTNFQQDFSNGFLFGELLHKYNQQLNFPQFLDKQDKKSKLKNFELLFDTFTALGVTFDSNVAHNIISKKTGSAKKVLYQLKMHLQKTKTSTIPAFNKISKTTKTLSPLKKLKISRELYDKVDKNHFVKQLNELHPAQKTLNQQKLLKKFSDFHEQQIKKNKQNSEQQKQIELSERKKFRDQQRDNLKKTADFRNEWENTNRQKWSANMTVRKLQREKETIFKTKLEQTKTQNKTMSELSALKALDRDISQFQKKIVKKAKPLSDSDSSPESRQDDKIHPPPQQVISKDSKLSSKLKFNRNQLPFYQGVASGYSPRKKGSQPQATQQTRHQREKKRRKMIVQQSKRYQLIEISRRERFIMSTIQQTSKQEKQLEYEIWRVWQNKEVIEENKQLQLNKEKEKVEVKQTNAQFKRKELLKTYRQEHEAQVQEAIRRQGMLLREQAVKDRKNTYRECSRIIDAAIEMMERCFLHQQQKNLPKLKDDFLGNLLAQFVQSKSSREEVAKLQLKNYIRGQGDWQLPIENRSEGQPTDPTLSDALPEGVINNYVLGNILRQLYEFVYQKTDEATIIKDETKRMQTACVVTLNGLDFAGKNKAAAALGKKFGFNVVELGALIQQKIRKYQDLPKDNVSQLSSQIKQLIQRVYAGKPLPDKLITHLLVEEIRNYPKTVLIDYPSTYQQLLVLVKELSGVQPSDHQRQSMLQQKIKSFSQLVSPTEPKVIPRTLKQCGIDLAVWVNVEPRTSFDRALGRREVKGKLVNIKEDITEEVYGLNSLEKASSQILRNHYKIVEKQKLKNFLEQFGIQILQRGEVMSEPQDKTLKKDQQKQEFKEEAQEEQLNQEGAKQSGRNDEKEKEDNMNQNTDKNYDQKMPGKSVHQKEIEVRKNEQKKEDPQKPQCDSSQESPNVQSREPVPQSQLHKCWVEIDGNCPVQQLRSRVFRVVQKAMQIKESKRQCQEKKRLEMQRQIQQENQRQLQEEDILKNQCILTSPENIQCQLEKILKNSSLREQFVKHLIELWESTQASTVKALTSVFMHLTENDQTQQEYLASAKRNFMVNILTREDEKFFIVKSFQIEYNAFHDTHPDMVVQDYTKEELHQRVDDLQDRLYECIYNKKQEALAERQSLMESGWLQNQLEQLHNALRILLQTELNRYNVSEKILSDYYSKRYSLPQEPYQLGTIEIPYDASLELYNKQNNTFPRIQKLFSEALRIFNRQEEQPDDKNKKGGKALPKKEEKKGLKKGDMEQQRESTPEEEEMKKALNVEKAIFRYRLNILNSFVKQRLYKVISQSENFYKQLEEYSMYTFQVENKAVQNLSIMLRSCIEQQQKIQNQLKLDYVDIIESQQIRNYEKPKPVILPARQVETHDKFTITHLLELIALVRNQSQAKDRISVKRLLVLFSRLGSQLMGEKLPQSWKQITFSQFQGFLTLLDAEQSGSVELWRVLLFFVMSGFTLPQKEQQQKYFNELTVYGTQTKIRKDKFLETPAWFDQEYQPLENSLIFDRNRHVKEILFDIFKYSNEESPYIEGESFVNQINLRWLESVQAEEMQSDYLAIVKGKCP